jgi:hypothetical protein
MAGRLTGWWVAGSPNGVEGRADGRVEVDCGCLSVVHPDDLVAVLGVPFFTGHSGPEACRQPQEVDEVETAEKLRGSGAGDDLVLDPAEVGGLGNIGDFQSEFLIEFSGQGVGDRLVRLDQTARYGVLLSVGAPTPDEAHPVAVEDDGAGADGQRGGWCGRPVAGADGCHRAAWAAALLAASQPVVLPQSK